MENKEEKIELEQSTVNINELPVVEVKEPTYNELRKMAKDKGLKFAKNASKEDLIKILDTAESVNVNVISLDNKPISPVVISNEQEEINAGFVATRPNRTEKKNVRGAYNGRVYKTIGNGYAIWCDNGQSFELSMLK